MPISNRANDVSVVVDDGVIHAKIEVGILLQTGESLLLTIPLNLPSQSAKLRAALLGKSKKLVELLRRISQADVLLRFRNQ